MSPARGPHGGTHDLGVRYHVPRRRRPGPVLGVAVLLLALLVGAQVSLAGGGDPLDDGGEEAAAAPDPAARPPAAAASPAAPATTPPADLVAVAEVPFGIGADLPEPGTADLLDDVVTSALADPGATVTVVGHAEASDDADLERQLSLERALRVVDLLGRLGVPAEQVQVVAAGASLDAGDADNRRVTVEVAPG